MATISIPATTIKYPDNFSVVYSYTPTGKLDSIKRGNDNSLIYKVNSRNQYHQTLNCQYGNGIITNYNYNQFGLLTGIQSGTGNLVLNYAYGYNTKGMMNFRQETNANREVACNRRNCVIVKIRNSRENRLARTVNNNQYQLYL
jgi:hypothetical protein